MTEPNPPAAEPTYEDKSARLKTLAAQMQRNTDEREGADEERLSILDTEREQLNQELLEFLSQPCGAHRETPNGGKVTCSRQTAHPDDHFDEVIGIGWANENEEVLAMGRDLELDAILDTMVVDNADRITAYVGGLREQIHRTHAILDRVGVPRDRLENTLTLVHRTNLFVDRLSKRLHGQVENNMALYNAIRDALTSLVGSPNASSLRVKAAIDRLRAVLPTKKSAGGIHLQ